MKTLSLTAEAFAADRRGIMARGDERLRPAVESALGEWGLEGWFEPLVDAALAWFDVVAAEEHSDPSPVVDDAREVYAKALRERLDLTSEPTEGQEEAQIVALTEWLSTSALNAATVAAAGADEEDLTLTWVTMNDRNVRASHRHVDGQTVPVGATFDIDGHDLHYPGEPVGPPEVWINCRCVVRPGLGGDMTATTRRLSLSKAARDALIAAATEEEVEVEDVEVDEVDTFAPEAWDDLDWEVPWHGVLAPVGVESGDRRKFAPGAITFRDLPVPLKWMPEDQMGHDGSVVVGNIERIWEEDGLIKGEGTLRANSPEGADVIDQIANRFLRGVSVDLDMAESELQNDDGSPVDFDDPDFDINGPMPLQVVIKGRVASSTLCAIPAFQEAYVALGLWADAVATEDPEAVAASAECKPCEVLAAIESASAEHAAEFGQWAEGSGYTGGEAQFTAADGTRYEVHEDGGIEVFAPGTKDGPGWVTNPKETQRLRTYWTKGKGAAKIRWGQPGDFNRCRRQLSKYIPNPEYLAGTCSNLHKVAIGVWPGQEGGGGKHSLAASGVDQAPAYSLVASVSALPAEWFGDPRLTGPTPLTVTDEGQVYGHIATWGTCHIGMAGQCVTPPRSQTGYAYFMLHTIATTEGEIAVGHLTMDTGHADMRSKAHVAAAHYDNTGAVVADVTVGEDDYGIWFAGAMRPDAPQEKVQAFRSGALSGDWRRIGQGMEMVAALTVNVPGFPIPRLALAASGEEQVSLVASGIVTTEQPAPAQEDDRIVLAVKRALAETKAADERLARVASAKKVARAQKARLLKERMH
jgi:hypothetical protein